MIIKKIRDSDRGGISLIILQWALLIFALTFTLATAYLKIVATQRSSIQGNMDSLLKDSIKAAINAPLPQGVDMEPSVLQNAVLQLYAQKLQIPSGNIAVQDFEVYTDADAGLPAPVGIQGTIPGRSVYANLRVTTTTPPITGIRYTGQYTVRALVALPDYFAPGRQWN